MRGSKRDSNDDDFAGGLDVVAARFGLAVADEAAAFRALPSQASSLSLDEWLAVRGEISARIVGCVAALQREARSVLSVDDATEWAVGVAAATLELDDDDAGRLLVSVAARLAEVS